MTILRLPRRALAAALLLFLASRVASAGPAPDWFITSLTGRVETGRWIADNPYRSEDEPYESYGMEWRWGIGKQSMIGRLFAFQDGKETGDFWQFRVFWHPGEDQAYIYQWGHGGLVGIGTINAMGNDGTRAEQTVFSPDGSQTRVGHESIESAGEMDIRSFDISEEGERTPRRHYVWRADDGPHNSGKDE